ncbi:MAG: hypothetical protein H7336_16585 [Bacteriovorax sp.]|nr:hypothetical protein [Bacteriovorax sp.]
MKILIICFALISSNVFGQDQFTYAKELYLSEQYTRAVFQFDTLLSSIPSGGKDRALVGLSASLWMLGDTKAAYDNMNHISNRDLSHQLETALLVSSGDLYEVKSSSHEKAYLNELTDLEADRVKSPVLAAVFSGLIPGAGHVYLGAYQSAAIVFIFSALTGVSTFEFAKKDLTTPAIASGVLFSIFYMGGIYSSYEGAVKMNQMKISKPKKDLNTKYFPILRLDF